ncbi:MAG: hypothetical protein H0V79_11815 [Actinobacteria bacterium]|nr:hypothetical protein [Actinomycetota bacterium]
MSWGLVAGALLAAATVVVIALPFLRAELAPEDLDPADERALAALAAAEEHDRALAALKELEFDHRTGKVTDDDYRRLVGPLRRRAASGMLSPEAAKKSSMQQFSASDSSFIRVSR